MKNVAIIGYGKVGASLAYLLPATAQYRLSSLVVKDIKEEYLARLAMPEMHRSQACTSLDTHLHYDFIFITTPDRNIREVSDALAVTRDSWKGTTVAHVSGAQPSTLLSLFAKRGAAIASLHPCMTFPHPLKTIDEVRGVYWGIEGCQSGREAVRNVVTHLQGIPLPISTDNKLLYHAGAVMVSNLLCGLMESGVQCLEQAGIARADALAIVRPLAQATLSHALNKEPLSALTGPIARGDAEIVASEIHVLSSARPDLGAIYQAISALLLQSRPE